MPKTWPKDTIRELIALAQHAGESKAALASAREAELFRFAIYNFRRQENIGYDVLVTIVGTEVILTRKPRVRIVQEESRIY